MFHFTTEREKKWEIIGKELKRNIYSEMHENRGNLPSQVIKSSRI
jgi:hypothetical protein